MSWREQADCRALPALWDGENYYDIVAAIDACHACPVLTDCTTWAHGRTDLVGIVAAQPRDHETARRLRSRGRLGRRPRAGEN